MKKFGRKLAVTLIFMVTLPVYATGLSYTIVVDAGSSGSRLHLFQIDDSTPVPVIKDIFSESTTPGLSSFAGQPEDAGLSLKKLFDDALVQLKEKNVDAPTVTVNILATAGMRLLPAEKQQLIYVATKTFIKSQYPFQLGEFKTITGKMEGLFGWLDVNYLANSFQNQLPTIGAIDMGGASTQITFITFDKGDPEDETTLTIGGRNYTVYSKSFLGLGANQALAGMNAMPDANTCYPQGYNNNSNFSFTSCDSLFAKLIQQYHIERLPMLPHQIFIAFSAIYYTYHDFLGVNEHPSRAAVETAITTFCTQTWDQLKNTFPNQPEKYLSAYCASSVYFDELLYQTYQLQDHQLVVADKMNQQSIDWTLGSVLYGVVSKP